MDQKKLSGESFVCKKKFSSDGQTEVVYEYTLPDYFPDIKRILHVFSDIRKTGMYISDDKVEYEGCVSCAVLYRGEDKSLQCAEFKAEFSDNTTVKGADGNVFDVSFSPKNMTLRALTPRKVGLKARIEAHTDIWGEESITPDIHGANDGEGIQTITQNISFCDTAVCEQTGIGVSEDISVPENMPGAQRVIYTVIAPCSLDIKADDGKAFVKGELRGIVIYETEGDTPEIAVMPVSVAVSHTVSCENVTESSVCIGKINVYDITSTVSENAQGEKRVIELDLLYDIKIVSNTEKNITSASDMYAVGCTGFPEYKNVRCNKNASFVRGNFSVNSRLEKDICENISGEILLAFGNIESASCSIADGKLICNGICDICAVFDGDAEYDSIRASVPFKGEIDIPFALNKIVDAECRCGEVKIRFDGENYFADTEIYIDSVLAEESCYNVIQSIGFEKRTGEDKLGAFTFYYPTSEEKVWDVAKKYGVSLEALKDANGISDITSHKNVIMIRGKK